jgi:hypothetical protein
MTLPHQLEMIDDLACYRPVAQVTFPEVISIAVRAILASHDVGARKLLIDVRGLTGFAIPNTIQRYSFAEQVARNARGLVIAVVADEKMIDPNRFGVTVARNRGALAHIFASEDDARKWLSEPLE